MGWISTMLLVSFPLCFGERRVFNMYPNPWNIISVVIRRISAGNRWFDRYGWRVPKLTLQGRFPSGSDRQSSVVAGRSLMLYPRDCYGIELDQKARLKGISGAAESCVSL
jgi:hypothetical protein